MSLTPRKYCSADCEATGPVCDFCTHYDFNGSPTGVYLGNGWCRFHKKQSEPEQGCDDFQCFNAMAEAVRSTEE